LQTKFVAIDKRRQEKQIYFSGNLRRCYNYVMSGGGGGGFELWGMAVKKICFYGFPKHAKGVLSLGYSSTQKYFFGFL